MSKVRIPVVDQIRLKMAQYGFSPDLSAYVGLDSPIPYRCPKGHVTTRKWHSLCGDRKIRCFTCGGATVSRDRVIADIIRKCSSDGSLYEEGSYLDNRSPFKIICHCGRPGDVVWMDARD